MSADTIPEVPHEEVAPVNPSLTPEQKFDLLAVSQTALQLLKGSYAGSKVDAVKLRKELMTTIKLCEDLRKVVLEHKKAIPTKPRVKKAVKIVDPVLEVIQTPVVEVVA